MENRANSENRTTVYYDGLCYLCSFEISHYQKMKGAESLRFVDITGPDFSAAQEQVDPFKIHESLHVRDVEGVLHTGVDAFIEIWKSLPGCQFMARAAQKSLVKGVLSAGYFVFAKVRPHLPRRSCENSPYCVK